MNTSNADAAEPAAPFVNGSVPPGPGGRAAFARPRLGSSSGSKGPIDSKGPIGSEGPEGFTGANGATGDAGATGLTGSHGDPPPFAPGPGP